MNLPLLNFPTMKNNFDEKANKSKTFVREFPACLRYFQLG